MGINATQPIDYRVIQTIPLIVMNLNLTDGVTERGYGKAREWFSTQIAYHAMLTDTETIYPCG